MPPKSIRRWTVRNREIPPYLERSGKIPYEEDVDEDYEEVSDVHDSSVFIKTKLPAFPIKTQSFSIRLSSCLTEDDCDQNSAY